MMKMMPITHSRTFIPTRLLDSCERTTLDRVQTVLGQRNGRTILGMSQLERECVAFALIGSVPMSAFQPFQTLAAYVCFRPIADIHRSTLLYSWCSLLRGPATE